LLERFSSNNSALTAIAAPSALWNIAARPKGLIQDNAGAQGFAAQTTLIDQ
jgi:hypothetical protein